MSVPNKVLLFAFSLTFAVSAAIAGEVLQVKGSKVLLNIGDVPVSQGSEVYAINPENKRKGLMTIRQIRDDKAVAELTKGRAEPGWTLRAKDGGAPKDPAAAESAPPAKSERVQDVADESAAPDRAQRPRGFFGKYLKRGTGVGIQAGLAQNSMSLTSKQGTLSEDLSLKGNSYNLVGFYDYDFSKTFTLRSVLGMETFNVSGTSTQAVCNAGTDCSVSFTYLAGEAHAHYNVVPGNTRVWIGAGFLFLFNVAKSSTVTSLDTSNATNQMFTLEGGADVDLGKGHFVPVSFEYGLYPGSSSVKAQSLALRAGYGWRF